MDPVNPEGFSNHQLSTSSLPDVEEVVYEKLSPKLLYRKIISSSITFVVLSAGAGMLYYQFPLFYNNFFPLILLLILLIYLWSFINNWQWQKRSGYALREKDILFRRGFLNEKTTALPFNRIQHVTTQRGVLDKMLGIATLHIFTAGGSGSDISIPGLTPALAAALKEALSESITEHV